MRRKRSGLNSAMDGLPAILSCLLFCIAVIDTTNAARRSDLPHHINRALMPASPSVETLKELAVAMGAAGFEQFAEGASKPIVKRLIPESVDADLEGEDYQGVIGKPGVDFPVLTGIPTTSFDCRAVSTGYYADLETDCQVFHICDTGRKISFLCPNGTIFRQSHLICDWWFKVDCSSSSQSSEDSSEQYSGEQLKKITLSPHPLSNHKDSDIQTINADASNIAIKAELNGKVFATNKDNLPVKSVSKFSFSSIEDQKPYTERTSRQRTTKTNWETSTQPNNNRRASSRSFHVLLPQDNFKVPAEFPSITETINEKRRRNLIKQINSRIPTTRSTSSQSYADANTDRSTPPSYENNPKESQVLAETAAFASNSNNRNFLQLNYDNFNNNLKSQSSISTTRAGRVKSANTAVTSSYVPDVRSRNEFLRNSKPSGATSFETTQKPTLIPSSHTSSEATVLGELPGDKHQPYTRPGVWLLKEHLDQLRNESTLNESSTESAINETETALVDAKNDDVTTKTPISEANNKNNDTEMASTIHFSIRHSDNFNNFNHISTEPTFSERRQRIGKKLQILDPTAPEEISKKFYGTRPGLIVPPSLTPHTLHSLAIYYATAMDNLYTTTEADDLETTTTPTSLDENQEYLTSLLTRNTIDNYSNLFKGEAKVPQNTNTESNSTDVESSAGDLNMSQSQGPLASSPQIRELAQVFTHALSAYLQDPEQFRKVLSEIRPTHPTFADIVTTPSSFTGDYTAEEGLYTHDDEDDEILGFSDDNKAGKKTLSQLRELGLSPPAAFPSISTRFTDTNVRSTGVNGVQDAPNSINRGAYPPCCSASISASYTSAPTPSTASQHTVQGQFTSPSSLEGINIRNNINGHSNSPGDSTESSYSLPRYGGFQNNSRTDVNSSPYGKDVQPANAKPLTIENYIRSNDIPTSWGETGTSDNSYPSTVSVLSEGDSNKNILEVGNLVKFDSLTTVNEEYTTPSPVYSSTTSPIPKQTFEYVTPTQSHNYTLEMESEEELQSAHSQSFLTPQNSYNDNDDKDNNMKNDKTDSLKLVRGEVKFQSTTPIYTTPNPTQSFEYTSTLKPIYVEDTGSTIAPVTSDNFFTSNEATRDNTGTYPWSTNYDNWHSTVILDPITLNEGLSVDVQSASTNPQLGDTQTTFWDQTPSTVFIPSTTPIPDYTKYEHITTLDQNPSAEPNDVFTLSNRNAEITASTEHSTTNSREGKSLPNTFESSEVTTEINTANIEEQMMEKAKEVLGELNVTSTDSLVKAMKKTKSNTVRRLILLLVQTCDDDHNKTAEASKKALLQALKSLSSTDNPQTDEDQTELPASFSETLSADASSGFHATNALRRMDTVPLEDNKNDDINSRQGKNLRLQAKSQNDLPDSSTETAKGATFANPSTDSDLTTIDPLGDATIKSSGRRGVRKFLVRTSPVDIKFTTTTPQSPRAEAQVLVDTETDSKSDTRAIELLRSLYTIAAKWG